MPSCPPPAPTLSARVARSLARVAHWRDADKGLLVVGLMAPFVASWTLRIAAAVRSPDVAPYLDRTFLPWMLRFELAQLAILAVLGGLFAARRREGRRHPVLMELTLQFFYVAQALAMYALGPFTSPFPLICVMFSVVVMLAHGIGPATRGLVTFTVLMGGATVLERLGAVRYAPLLSPEVQPRPPTGWMVSVGVSAYLSAAAMLFLFALVVREWRARERELSELSQTDELTRVANRREFLRAAQRALAEGARTGRAVSAVLVDVDHFKRVNDTHGHPVGDRVLVQVAEALRQEVRGADLVARYGGEEFVLLLPGTDAEGARVVAERCRAHVAALRCEAAAGGPALCVTASFGVATATTGSVLAQPEDVASLLQRADEALYAAKQGGRDRVVAAA